MESLQVKAYATGFNHLSSETQEELLENLLKSTIGEKILYQREVSKMMEWFTDPIARNLIGRCSTAEKFLLTEFKYSSSWENINNNLPSWFDRKNIGIYVSEDRTIVYISEKSFLKQFEINGQDLTLDDDYDIKLITETNFDLNNLYLGRSRVEKWWEYCIQLA